MILYNELDPFPAQWLRNLIDAHALPAGVVSETSIAELDSNSLFLYKTFHAFAGIGGWPYALRLAGAPDDFPVWTGSCPCQPFSQSGAHRGFEDPRHLWPAWFKLIARHKPPVIFGEQVASPAGLHWLDLVSTDLENAGYAVGAADLCAASVGAPHIRQRLYFVAYSHGEGRELLGSLRLPEESHPSRGNDADGRGAGELADAAEPGRSAWGRAGEAVSDARLESGRRGPYELGNPGPERIRAGLGGRDARTPGEDGRGTGQQRLWNDGGDAGASRRTMDDPSQQGLEGHAGDGDFRDQPRRISAEQARSAFPAGLVGGFWGDAEWIPCKDPKRGVVYRPVEPKSFPLAHGAPARVGRLRGYGNAIVAHLAAQFVRAAAEAARC